MGFGRYDSDDFARYSTTHDFASKSADEVTNKSTVVEEFLPHNFNHKMRESRDSELNPSATPIIVAGDVTGSMGSIAGELIKKGLDGFFEAMYDRKPVTDPHIMGMAVGDVQAGDRVPIQCTQFEADIKIVEQFHRLYVEGAGGGNSTESYSLPWFIAATMCRTDQWEKRRQKGVLFTYGDEEAPITLTPEHIRTATGVGVQSNVEPEHALRAASAMYDVYHLVIEQGSHCRYAKDAVYESWRKLLGQHVIPVKDYTQLAEIMVSIMELRAGKTHTEVSTSWGKLHTADVVTQAIRVLPAGS